MIKRHLFWLLFLLGFGLVLAAPAAAQQPVTDDEINAIAKDLYCPVCENTPLDVCATQACQDWRDEIRSQLEAGRTKAEIQQYFVDRYGARVLSTPPQQGFNWLIWVLPIVLGVVGVVLFALYMRSLQVRHGAGSDDDTFTVAQGGAQKPPPLAGDDDYVSRIEKELRE